MNYPEMVLSRLRYQYCPMCRTELIKKIINDDNIDRVCCPCCNWVHFPANARGVVILITTENGIVAILPPNSPEDFPAALPGGHGEYGESPEDAAIREAFEETGFEVEITELLGWEFIRNMTYPGPIINFYFQAGTTGGGIRDSQEGRVKIYELENFPSISAQRGGSTKTMQLYLEKINTRAAQFNSYAQECDLPTELAKPARRALTGAGYLRLEQFTKLSEGELLKLHGMGPKALEQIRRALAAKGQSLAE